MGLFAFEFRGRRLFEENRHAAVAKILLRPSDWNAMTAKRMFNALSIRQRSTDDGERYKVDLTRT